MKLSRLSLAALLVATAGAAWSESNIVGGAGNAVARLDFSVTIPRVLFLQVGSGTLGSNIGTIDTVTFTPTAAELIGGGAVAASANGTVIVRVAGNNGIIQLNAAAGGQMGNGAGGTMPWTEIGITAQPLVAGTTPGWTQPPAGIAHPSLTAAGVGSAVNLGAANTTLRQEAQWVFAYNNSALYLPGTYGTNANNGRLTYTASMP